MPAPSSPPSSLWDASSTSWSLAAGGRSGPALHSLLLDDHDDQLRLGQVTREEGEKLAAALDALYIETSAKQNLGVEDAFSRLCSKIVERIRAGDIDVSLLNSQYIVKLFLQVREDTEGLKVGIHETIIDEMTGRPRLLICSPLLMFVLCITSL